MAHVAVSIVAWNSMKHLPEALASVAKQSFPNVSLIVVDNASDDGAAEFVREQYPQAMVLRNAKNLGFARAHNQAIAHARTHLRRDGDLYVLVMNPDAVMEQDYLATMVDHLERRPEVGSAAGKIYRMVRSEEETSTEGQRTDIIDTAGMQPRKSRRIDERGDGMRDDGGLFARTEEVFGVSGALALYRMTALEDVAYGLAPETQTRMEEYFDDDFFAYKEDADLAWRLRLRGWQALYVPTAKAYHYRTAAGGGASNLQTLRNRFRKPKRINYLSYRNHFLLLLKNDRFFDVLLALPWILWYEMRKAGVILLFETGSLRAWPAVLGLFPRMMAKRKHTMRNARVKGKEIRKWFV